MTDIEAKYILNKHALLFNFALQNREVPSANSAINEIASVVKHYEPNRNIDMTCGSCLMRLMEDANSIRLSLNETYKETKEYKFPKQ
jgi:hypothetical protein